MSSVSAVAASLRTDALRMSRDRFLVGTAAYIVGISVVMRWAIPWIARGVGVRWGFDLTPYYGLIVSHIVIQLAPLLLGILGGFLLLETREDRTMKALLVSPMPLVEYLSALSAALVVCSMLLTLVEAWIIGIALPGWPVLLGAGFVGALTAPIIALLVAAVSSNKTEAFAYLKVFGVAPLLASGAYFLDEPMQWVAGVYPPYWAVKAFWVAEAGAGAWPAWLLGGVVVAVLWASVALLAFGKAARE